MSDRRVPLRVVTPDEPLTQEQVERDVEDLSFCLHHGSGLTEEEMTAFEDGWDPCVHVIRLDDLEQAGLDIMPATTSTELSNLRERLNSMSAQYALVLDDIGELGEAVGLGGHGRPESPRDFLRECITEVKNRFRTPL